MRSSKTSRNPLFEKQAWHALRPEAVVKVLQSGLSGLTFEEVKRRRQSYGKNVFTEVKEPGLVLRFFFQFKNPLGIVLLVAFLVTFALGHYVDAVVIFTALLVAVIVGILQEEKASRAFQKLTNSQTAYATVMREGKKHHILAEEIVPGDIVLVQGGVQVPADLRLVEAKRLSVNEASLTGEWAPVKKQTDPVQVGVPFAEMSSMLHQGTFISEGYGTGIVVATGDDTMMGSLANDVASIKNEKTPIQEEMEHTSRAMLVIVIVLIVSIFALGLLRGEGFESMLLMAIAIAVAAIPEGLPAAITIILAVGMESLLSRGGLVRNLLAAETLGSTTYILTDKTGTLTEARMTVSEVILSQKEHKTDWKNDDLSIELLDVALAASDAYLEEEHGDVETYAVRGKSVERAILEAALEVGITITGNSTRGQRIDFLAFESKNRYSAALSKSSESTRLCIMGAPELLLQSAEYVRTEHGTIPFEVETRSYFQNILRAKSREGKRLIAVAYQDVLYKEIPEQTTNLLEKSVFFGLIVIDDPIRSDVKEAIAGVQKAGAVVRLVTGDNAETALSVACRVGIARPHDIAITGDRITELDDKELLEVLKSVPVYARILPRQKMRIAEVLQKSGEIVAMTGDGINDAAALRKANIGVALGSGTEVAKESSDLVLVHDTFSTIYAAIEEGRRIVSNLRRIMSYLLSTSLSETLLIAGALISGGPIPILPVQVLWSNMIEEGLMSVAFAFEKGSKKTMQLKPRDIHAEGILSKQVLLFVGLVIGVLGILLLSLYALLRIFEIPAAELRSIMFLAISLDSLFVAYSFRSLNTPIFKIPLWENRFFVCAFLVNLVLLGVIVTVPFFERLLSYTPLPSLYLSFPFAYGILALVVVEIAKWFFFMRRR